MCGKADKLWPMCKMLHIAQSTCYQRLAIAPVQVHEVFGANLNTVDK
jgi:hypothetical protein